MTEQQPEKPEHPAWPAPGQHMWSKWYPNTSTTQRRFCLHPKCNEVEVKKA